MPTQSRGHATLPLNNHGHACEDGAAVVCVLSFLALSNGLVLVLVLRYLLKKPAALGDPLKKPAPVALGRSHSAGEDDGGWDDDWTAGATAPRKPKPPELTGKAAKSIPKDEGVEAL